MKFICDCGLHQLDINMKPLRFSDGVGEDYIGMTIYEHKSPNTGKKYRKRKEQGTVVLIGKEARKFKQYFYKTIMLQEWNKKC